MSNKDVKVEEILQIDKYDFFVEKCPSCNCVTCEKYMIVDGSFNIVDAEYHICEIESSHNKPILCATIKDCAIKNTIKQLQRKEEENKRLRELIFEIHSEYFEDGKLSKLTKQSIEQSLKGE